jgi:putative aldouronate transport system permease protein
MYANILGMKNTYFALLVPLLLLNGFNVLLVRTYFANNIPVSLIEAARIDGAGEVRTFFQIVVPMATPILATIGMLIGIAYWNDWYNGLLFSTKVDYFSLQNFLYKIMMDLKFLSTNAHVTSDASSIIAKVPSNTVRMAMAFIGTIPVMVVFPFMQKYFARGLTLGSVKE